MREMTGVNQHGHVADWWFDAWVGSTHAQCRFVQVHNAVDRVVVGFEGEGRVSNDDCACMVRVDDVHIETAEHAGDWEVIREQASVYDDAGYVRTVNRDVRLKNSGIFHQKVHSMSHYHHV